MVNYKQAILGLFEQAWNPSASLDDRLPVVETTVIISPTGKVDSRITRKSGVPALDSSVQRVLDTVRQVDAPPDGSKDQEYIINFNLKNYFMANYRLRILQIISVILHVRS